VIAFPKTATASDLMTGAPSPADDAQLKELGVRIKGPSPT
jgi:aspartyl-tRNA synthetase